ncbi:hypothetical protein WH8501_21945 [Crocosphaera watsonii WH 8501]|uniref:hypothetical protein n=1 Tax=Crocosphaera watsonii TaxID=263511 RepID=UPI0002E9FE93
MTTSQEKIEQTLTPSKPYKPHVIFRLLPTLTLVALTGWWTRISHKICDRQTQKPYRKWV